jgi:hypothetical protein
MAAANTKKIMATAAAKFVLCASKWLISQLTSKFYPANDI